MSAVDVAGVMAEHIQDNQGRGCDVCYRTSWPCLPYRLAEALARVAVVLDEAYREDVGLTTWSEHPELELPQRHEAWLDEEERQGR